MTRLGYGALEVRHEAVDLRETVGRAMMRLKHSLADHRIVLDLALDLPLADGDPVLIEQVATNILDNAAKYSDPGTTIIIAGRAEARSPRPVDHRRGAGHPRRGSRQDLRHVLSGTRRRQPEGRHRPRARHLPGNPRSARRQHQGAIGRQRQDGNADRGGTSHRPKLVGERAGPGECAPGRWRMSAGRILIVDDEPQIRKFLRIALEAHQFEVSEAGRGAEAIEKSASETPDLVVLDLGLPDIDGKEVVRRVREWSRVPILILSVRQSRVRKGRGARCRRQRLCRQALRHRRASRPRARSPARAGGAARVAGEPADDVRLAHARSAKARGDARRQPRPPHPQGVRPPALSRGACRPHRHPPRAADRDLGTGPSRTTSSTSASSSAASAPS